MVNQEPGAIPGWKLAPLATPPFWLMAGGEASEEPRTSLNTVPAPWAPPPTVAPIKLPSAAWINPTTGPWPSAQACWEQKLYNVVSVPPRVSLKIVPPPAPALAELLAPAVEVVPLRFPSAA